MMKTKAKISWLAPALLLGCSIAEAGDVRMYHHGEIPQASEVADILSGGTRGPKMRGISLDAAYSPTKKAGQEVHKLAQPGAEAIGLPVEFAFNSAEIKPNYRTQLDAIAEGIKIAGNIEVMVEGHTDAHGPDAYNEQLSKRRAEAVKRYLVERHGINVSRLIVKGYGEKAPLEHGNPFAAANRRVQFRAAN